jgi:two-component system sensor histidine kinase/response regulator
MADKPRTFLVVDDFESMRKVTATQLRDLGVQDILTAANGAEALRVLKTRRVDFVLSDWNMPVMDGLSLLKALRDDAAIAHLPFIMITAEAERRRVEEAIDHGVSDFLVKPYTLERLRSRIERALTRKPGSALLRAVAATVAEDEEPPPAKAEPGRPTILVVDDTPDNLQLLSRLFKDDYRVRIAHNGSKALDICCSDTPPDLVLLDVMMPGIDGFEVLERMRAHPNAEHIPVIFVTALTADESRIRGLQLGAVDYVTKPIDPDILQVRVRNFMRYVELHRQLQGDYDAMLEAARLREDVEHITRHDMKAPLAGLIGLIRDLATDRELHRKQVAQLRLAEETALQLLDMINLSSELYKIETGRFRLKAAAVPIGDILRRIVEIARVTFAAKRLVIAVDVDQEVGAPPPQADGDALLCHSLFQNLVKNACEAAPDNTRVSVALRIGDPLRVTIENKGAVPAAIRTRFFEKFVTHGKRGGTGLGTYSAKLLAEAQGGAIALDVSDADDRTRLTVDLPRHAEDAPAPAR